MARAAYRRYRREFFPAIVGYMLVMVLLWPQVHHVRDPLLKGLLALVPVLPMVLVIRAMVRLVLGSDELEQRIHLIGLAVSTALVGTLSMVGGFLAAAGVVAFDGTILIWVFPALVIVYGLARGWASRRYGSGGVMGCDDEDSAWQKWHLPAGGVLGLLAWLGWGRLPDYGVGVLLGCGAPLMLYGAYRQIRHRWRQRRPTGDMQDGR